MGNFSGWMGGVLLLTVSALATIRAGADPAPPPPAPVVHKAPAFENDPDAAPDALIVTQSLSKLPAAILQQPLLKALLTQDFSFYYQETPSFLSLNGTIKRLAFEHDLGIMDRLLAFALSSPAEMAFWRNYDGRLSHYMLVLERTWTSDIMTALAKFSAEDPQFIKETGENVYRIRFAGNRDLFFTTIEDRLVVFNHKKMPLPTAEKRARWAELGKKRFEQEPASGVFRPRFEANADTAKHSIFFSLRYLSFGYQAFFSSMDNLKFRFGEKGWETHLLAHQPSGETFSGVEALWKSLPSGASLCAVLPIDKASLGTHLEKVFKGKAYGPELMDTLGTHAGLCWYDHSKLYTPLFLVRASDKVSSTTLKSIFERGVGNWEAGYLTEEQKAQSILKAEKFEPPLSVTENKAADEVTWTRMVSSPYGIYDAKETPLKFKLKSERFFQVRLALKKDFLVFSPDDRLVDLALSVIGKKYPAISDSISGSADRIGFYLAPAKIATLFKAATKEALPTTQDIFAESVSKWLYPALDRLKKFSPVVSQWPVLSGTATDQWGEVKWQTLSAK